jgi:HSP20 family protein
MYGTGFVFGTSDQADRGRCAQSTPYESVAKVIEGHKKGGIIMALPARVGRMGADAFEAAQREFDGLLNRFFGGAREGDGGYLAPYAVDVREDADHIYVEAELPGYKKNDVEITLENQTLTIAAERKEEQKQEQKGQMLLHERRYSRFLRAFTLPPTVDDSKVDAKLADGVLTVTLNKREETKPRKITVA